MGSPELTTERIQNKVEMGVFEETAPLKHVMMWGKPGVETALGMLLPTRISCFQSNFRVPEARVEFNGAVNILQENGVEILFVKELLAKMIKEKGLKPSMDRAQLEEAIKERGRYFYSKHEEEIIKECKEIGEEPIGLAALDWVSDILDEDEEEYGTDVALVMNQILSLDPREGLEGDDKLLPLSNVIYARDQSNLLGKVWIWSNMCHPIRQAEVGLFRSVLDFHHIIPDDITQVQIQGSGKFEGGDGIVYDGTTYIGCGKRSNIRGIFQAAPYLLAQSGAKLVISYNGKFIRGEQSEMPSMHLDTYWMPSGPNEITYCHDVALERTLVAVTMDDDGKLWRQRLGSFNGFWEASGKKNIDISQPEQENYAPNYLNLGKGKIVMSVAKYSSLADKLKAAGHTVFDADLQQITKGFGGLHCMTAALKRG